MRNIYLDFETYYASDYTLGKMSIEEYVRDPRFAAYLCCLAIDNSPIYAVGPDDLARVLPALGLDRGDTRTFMHNGKFDGFILSQRYGIHIAHPVCTRCLGRWCGLSRLGRESLKAQSELLNTGHKGTFIGNMLGRRIEDLTASERKAYVDYCRLDVDLLRNNARILMEGVPDDVVDFIGLSLNMYLDPVFVLDREGLENYRQQLLAASQAAQERLSRLFSFNSVPEFLKALRSRDTFCKMMESIGGKVPMKVSEARTATARAKLEARLPDPEAQRLLDSGAYVVMTPSLAKNDPEFVALMNSDNEDIAELARARAENNSSIAMSRCLTFQRIAERGTLPVSLEAYFAHTGRYSAGASDDMRSDATNLQNLAKRGADLTLRKCVQVPAGHKLVACDSSQIEARVEAWISGETWLLQAFANKEDPYCHMASSIYSEPYETILDWTKGASAHDENADPAVKKRYKTYRNVGKTAVLQLGYYAGASKLALYLRQQGIMLGETVEQHEAEARRIVQIYRNRNSCIRDFWRMCDGLLRAMVDGDSGLFGPGNVFRFNGKHLVCGRRVPGVRLPDGYWLCYPELRTEIVDGRPEYRYTTIEKGKEVTKRIHAGVLCNNICQGTAFALIRWQAVQINKLYPIRINIHDSLGVVVPEAQAQQAYDDMVRIMSSVPAWAKGMPVACEAEIGVDFRVA